MSYAIGIDLGTTNSTVSVFRRGVIETLPIEGKISMPSVVSFLQGGEKLVGLAAKARRMLDPEHTVASAKRFMGDRNMRYQMYGQSFTVVDIASMVLKRLVESACKELGEEVRDVVITVPAYFTEAQREDTKRAGEQAGLNVLRLIPEPTAAAIAYGLDHGKNQLIMVYDLGGGTFDISILEVKNNRFTVEAVGGDSRLGGDDVDELIMEWANKQFQAQTGIDPKADDSRNARAALQRLKEAAENAKIELSEASSASIIVTDFFGHPLELELSLSEFNRLCEPLLARTMKLMRSVLVDAKHQAKDIDRVILVGGSTKIRAVRDAVAKEIKEPYIAERVDEVVSHGAAVRAADLYLPDEDVLPIEVVDVTGHSLGVDLLNEKGELIFYRVIPKQTRYPCRKGFLCETSRPMQTAVLLRVFRGEDHNPEKNTYLGELTVPVSSPQPKPVPLVAVFELDEDGIIKLTAVQLTEGLATKQILAGAYGGELDLTPVDKLIRSGNVTPRSVTIRNE